ncbi:Na(+)-translocating NADH-quinone reductase subunit A [Oleiphilus messinensis]|uniref:Na(+)-translocating NADH-quinone reductase subunit A n=1 Tax=Oleiphilus messinensis TaxID=141451 RepID=A0A1Y0IA66_9GAMM|nr:Na(+)-translocating NADH-quinone reductase subunit A [Oleiphilus messinensis]ARU56656.1 Na(+)-translocating NADH-quinone reductase subunit A [Oleiphilus messinensis]
MIKIQKGLDLPIKGSPEQKITAGKPVSRVAVVGFDYNGMKPTMAVQEGDKVKRGQLLFEDKKTVGVKFTAPAAGTVKEVNRGEKRVFQSIVIEIEGDDAVQFERYSAEQLDQLTREQVTSNLIESGMWSAIRTRPFSKSPELDAVPNSIFVSIMDTQPLSADPEVIVSESLEAFNNGLKVVSHLTNGKVFVCAAENSKIQISSSEKVVTESFSGPHPAGNVGTHIHHLDPVSLSKSVWHIGYQDIIAIGQLFVTGELYTDRIVALSGPKVTKPRLVRTRVGADLNELTAGEFDESGPVRVISGSVFGGRTARGAVSFLGHFANQITILEEGTKRDFMGWLSPGTSRFSKLNIYLSKLTSGKLLDFSTNTNGSDRAMVPVGTYEEVMPLDILPTQLLRALVVGDTDMAQKLGALELDEEDLSLCTFVCPGKYEYGPILRQNLTRIELEG